MRRFMVWMGFGSLLAMASMVNVSTAQAEMPRYMNSSAIRTSPSGPGLDWHDSLESGWQESRRRNVPMVIYITSEQCHYCDAMKRDTWCDQTIRQRLARNFVLIRLTPRRNSATLNRIDVTAYPTTLVGIPRGKIIGHRVGYQPPSALHGLLSETENRATR